MLYSAVGYQNQKHVDKQIHFLWHTILTSKQKGEGCVYRELGGIIGPRSSIFSMPI